MQVEELYDLTSWIQSEIVEARILQKYQQLHAVLHQNSQPHQPRQPFENEKNDLISALRSVSLADLSVGQLEVLANIGIAENVGEAGVEKIEESLFRNVIDAVTSAANVEKSIQEMTVGLQWSKQVRDLLEKIIDTEEVSEIGASVLLRVRFTGDAHLSNLKEFKDWGKTWWEIGRGIAMAHGESPEDIKVVGASKGSIIISLLATLAIAKTTSGIIMEALKVAEKVLDIRKKAQEVRALMLANDIVENNLDVAEKNLNEAALKQKTSGVEAIVKKFIDSLEINTANEGDKVAALDGSVKKLVDFIERGGEVDFVLPDEEGNTENTDGHDEREGLRVAFKEIRQLEKRMHQIEHEPAAKNNNQRSS